MPTKTTDKAKLLELLKIGPVLTCDLRKWGISGNPAQRRLDLIADGIYVHSAPTKDPATGRRAAKYWLA